jgi:hypothetical protein
MIAAKKMTRAFQSNPLNTARAWWNVMELKPPKLIRVVSHEQKIWKSQIKHLRGASILGHCRKPARERGHKYIHINGKGL